MNQLYIVDDKRISTMRARLGKASNLVLEDSYLPLFRARQIKYSKEFKQSVKFVKWAKKQGKIKNIHNYFAKIWSNKNIVETLKIMREFLNRQISKLAEKREDKRKNEEINQFERDFNGAGYAKFQQLKRMKLSKQFQ